MKHAPKLPEHRCPTLTPDEMSAILRAIDDVTASDDVGSFRERTLNSLYQHLGYEHSLFMAGETARHALCDQASLSHGFARSADSFRRDFCRLRLWSAPDAAGLLEQRRVIGLDDISSLGRRREALELAHLLLRHGLGSMLMFEVARSSEVVGLVAVFGRNGRLLGAHDRTIVAVTARHFSAVLRLLAPDGFRYPLLASALTPRQRQVVALTAEGMNNRQIAEALSLSEFTVKRHMSSALRATGCSGRTQLALDWRREGGHPHLRWDADD